MNNSHSFPSPLVTVLQDVAGNALEGWSIVLTAPSLGASCVFANEASSITLITDENGQVQASFTANRYPGTYTITADLSGGYNVSTVEFVETNTAVPPAVITKLSGDQQAVTLLSSYQAFIVQVTDGIGNLGT